MSQPHPVAELPESKPLQRLADAFGSSYEGLGPGFFSRTDPTPVADPRLIIFNRRLAEELGLDVAALDDDALGAIFSGRLVLPGTHPIATVYAGHQFGQFVPQLGDGRAILLGDVRDRSGRRRDIQLKGSGRTPYSRGGDGRAALGPVLREYLVSEAMHALGVPATRALAAVTTGEPVAPRASRPGRRRDARRGESREGGYVSIFCGARRYRGDETFGRLCDRPSLSGRCRGRQSLS